MEGATLTIAFKDESSPGAAGSAATPQQGSSPNVAEQQLQDQLKAIIAAGGIGIVAANNQQTTSSSQPIPVVSTSTTVQPTQALPSPAITTATSSNTETEFARSVDKIRGLDPNATATEIAKLMGGGTTANQVQGIIDGTRVTVATPITSTATASTDDTAMLIRRERRLANEERDRVRVEEEQRKIDEAAKAASTKPPPPPMQAPPIYEPTPPPLSREQQLQESERRAPPRPRPYEETQEGRQAAQGAQNTVNALAHFAHGFGPIGSAIAGVATSTMQMPGMAAAVAGVAPALIASAPIIAAAAAVAVIPSAVSYALENVINTARGQVQGLSGEVAAAEANASIRQLIANIRTSEKLGDEITDYVANRSRGSAARQGIRDTLSEPFIRDYNSLANIATKISESVDKGLSSSAGEKVYNFLYDITVGTSLAGAIAKLNSLLEDNGNKIPETYGFLNIVPENPQLPAPFSQRPADFRGPKDIDRSKPEWRPTMAGSVHITGIAGP